MSPDHALDDAWVEEVLRFWFAELREADWWAKSERVDATIRARYLDLHARLVAADGGVSSAARPALAAVIVLDQFSRNMFRGTPRSFAQDPLALALAEEILASDDYATLAPIERAFILLPLMHAEDPARQRRCVAEYQELLAAAESEELRRFFANNVDYGERHAAIIERFGRFPHRNAVLGRASTAEELEFLKQPGSSF